MNFSKNENEKQIKHGRDKNRKVKNKTVVLFFRFIVIVSLILIFAVGGAVMGAVLGVINNSPDLTAISIKPNVYTTIIKANKTLEEIARLDGSENREYATLDKISLELQNSFIAIEDERFYSHSGIDFRSILRASFKTISGDRTEGASTITQQVIKNNVTKVNKNSLKSKVQEMYLAVQYEKELAKSLGSKKLAKDYILELYLNTINLGHGNYGVKTASLYYFNKDAYDINLSEAAVISAITQNPTKNSPKNNQEKNNERKNATLNIMRRMDKITDSQLEEAKNDDVYSRINETIRINDESESYNSYFVDQLIKEVSGDLQSKLNIGPQEAMNYIYNGGLEIQSTQDTSMQKIMDDAFLDDSLFPSSGFEIEVIYLLSTKNTITGKESNHERTFTVKNKEEIQPLIDAIENELVSVNEEIIESKQIPIPQPQAAMVIIDYRTGEVLAISGGRGEKLVNRSFNRATDARRQPGSVFKILAAYAPALDLGLLSPDSIIVDEPFTVDEYKYTPRNWNGTFLGPITIRTAVAQSVNIAAVKTLMNVGIDVSFKYLQNFGFTKLIESEQRPDGIYTDKTPSLSLGGLTDGVTQLEVTAAYGTIANDGQYIEPYFYERVLDHDGNVLLSNVPEPVRVIKKETSYMLTDIMRGVVTSGTGTSARFRNSSMPVVGKTGTTSYNDNLTFVGYTPYYVAGVWLGYDTPKAIAMPHTYHMLLWRTVMEKIHESLEIKAFPYARVPSNPIVISGENIPDEEEDVELEEDLEIGDNDEGLEIDPDTGLLVTPSPNPWWDIPDRDNSVPTETDRDNLESQIQTENNNNDTITIPDPTIAPTEPPYIPAFPENNNDDNQILIIPPADASSIQDNSDNQGNVIPQEYNGLPVID